MKTEITIDGVIALYELGFRFEINDGDIVGLEEINEH